MSKRKSRTKSMFVDKNDLVFEDDSDPELLAEINTKFSKNAKPEENVSSQTSGDIGSTRVSSRAKKTKSIYDPSEYNGPVHKKKREALEALQNAASLKKQQKIAASTSNMELSLPPQPRPPPAVPTTPARTPKKMPPRTPPPANKTPKKTSVDIVKTPNARIKQIASEGIKQKDPVKAMAVSKTIRPTINVEKPGQQIAAAVAVAPVQASPSKRKEKHIPKVDYGAELPSTSSLSRVRARSPSTSGNSEFEKASTVELNVGHIPDVTKWSPSDVSEYFIKQGFDEKDAHVLKKQEIDGETLMILRREDLRNLNLRLGVFVKMWNRIVKFQSGSNDISQGWK